METVRDPTATASPAPRVGLPVLVLAGFLGSGKTTLLNSLLHASDLRIGAIVNDFGDIPVDAALVDASVDATASLGGGCLCCVTDSSQLDAMLETLAAPERGLDAIVIEASGLADPAALALRVARSRVHGIRFAGVVLTVDASAYRQTLAVHPELAVQPRAADVIVVNKCDLAEASELEAVTRSVSAVAQGAPTVPAVDGEIAPELLFDRATRPVEPQQPTLFESLRTAEDDHDHAHPHLHDQYESVSFTSDRRMSPHLLLELLYSRPTGVIRYKGFVDLCVRSGPGSARLPHVLQGVGGSFAFTRQHGDHPVEGTRLVFIGRHLDRDGLLTALRGCERERQLPEDRAAMISVNRTLLARRRGRPRPPA